MKAKKIKVDGLKQATEILQYSDPAMRERLLAAITKNDPKLAEIIKKHMVTFEDLKFLTSQMVQELMRVVSATQLGLALRASTKELQSHLLSNLSKNNQSEVLEFLQGKPRSVKDVFKAQDEIMDKVRELMEKGKIVLSKDGSEKYV